MHARDCLDLPPRLAWHPACRDRGGCHRCRLRRAHAWSACCGSVCLRCSGTLRAPNEPDAQNAPSAAGSGPLDLQIVVETLPIETGAGWRRRHASLDSGGPPRRGRRGALHDPGHEPGQGAVTDIVVTKRLPFGVHYIRGSAVGPRARCSFRSTAARSFQCRPSSVPARAASAPARKIVTGRLTRTCAGFSVSPWRRMRPRCCAFARRSPDDRDRSPKSSGPGRPACGYAAGLHDAHAADRHGRACRRGTSGERQLIVEAGTGTGKTFAYLVPALISGRRVIVSTGTRHCRTSLFHRDLPAICAALGRPVRVALLKGRANYLCRHRLDVAEQQAYTRGLKREVATALPKVRAWSHTTRKGDIAELPNVGEQDPVWPWVTSTRENCLGAECPKFDDCFVLAARREAQAADILVVNHYLLMADLVLKEEGFGDLLPGADAIVIDEAHQLPDVAAQFLGLQRQHAPAGGIVEGRRRRTAAGAPDGRAGRWRDHGARCAGRGRARRDRRPGSAARARTVARAPARSLEWARRPRARSGRCDRAR